jgi:hypothetical protein
LGEEFHHNRIRVICSQISGLSPALDHRWSVERLERTVMSLAAEGRVFLQPLVTHVFDAEDAHEAFSILDQRPAPGDVVQPSSSCRAARRRLEAFLSGTPLAGRRHPGEVGVRP